MELTKETGNFRFECPEVLIAERNGRQYRNIQKITYHSNTTGLDRQANVVLPLGYSEEKKYPVLYILHGMFGNENTMLYDEDSKIPEILGNMKDAGLAKEVIAVFTNIYAKSDPKLAPGFSIESLEPYDRFIYDLIDDLDPYMESNFSVLTGRKNKALLGFSMGAMEAMFIGIKRSDFFSYLAAAAPAPGLIYAKDWAMEHPGLVEREDLRIEQNAEYPLDVFLLCRGGKDSVVGKYPVEYHEVLDENKVDHIWYEAPGLEHGEKIVQSTLFNLMLRWK